MYHNDEFKLLEEYSKQCPDAEITKACEEIRNQYNEYNDGYEHYTSNYKKTMEDAFDNFHIRSSISTKYGGEYYGTIEDAHKSIKVEVENYIHNLNTLKYLKILSENKKVFVMVGPNGSGKTTLLRELISATGENKIGYFPADRLFVIDTSFSAQRSHKLLLNDIEYTDSISTNIDDTNQAYSITKQMNQTIALFEKTRYMEMDEKENGEIDEGGCRSNQVLSIWNDLIRDRKLFSHGELLVSTLDGIQYPIKYLSSGEKSVFYFLTNILLKEEKEYYFIDEPENNLNPAVVSKLWNILEKERPNSVFVYLTHDSEFVSSRINSRNYWIEKYDGNNWTFTPLPKSEVLPQKLIVSLQSAKRNGR